MSMILSLVLMAGQATKAPDLKQLQDASNQGDLAVVEALLSARPSWADARDEAGVSFLLNALYRRKWEVAEAYAKRRQAFDIFEASALGRESELRSLLQKDERSVNSVSPDGFFPLGLAAFFAKEGAVRILLEAGADVNQYARSPHVQALHAAAAGRCLECVRLLLEKRADPNAPQDAGFRALHEAASSNDRPMAELLISKGATPGIKEEKGRTPADIARERGHLEMAAWLESLSR